MWCAYEKICKLDPKVDPGRMFGEINPSVMLFSQKFINRNNKDFTLSPDVNNNFKANLKNTSSTNRQVSRFNLLNKDYNSIQEDNDENDKGNFMEFKFLANMTPVMNKDRDEYQNLQMNQPPLIKINNKNFNFSSSPCNNIELNFKGFNNTESSDKHSKLMENIKPFNIYHQMSNSSRGMNDSSFFINNMNNSASIIDENINNNIASGTGSVFKVDFNGTRFNDISELLKTYGEILKLVSIYHAEDCLNKIKLLPTNHQKSGLILSIQGRCLFELARYKEAEKVFKECMKLEPARLEGIEYFSSCLWHLKEQYQLCTLANHVLEISQFCPETWIVVGNCYSLQREHEVALKFFNRAIQLDNNYAYAYTLCGHEYVDMESYPQAKVCYNQAIKIDARYIIK
jgi:tetratricopeptide (TPR) repeat protein